MMSVHSQRMILSFALAISGCACTVSPSNGGSGGADLGTGGKSETGGIVGQGGTIDSGGTTGSGGQTNTGGASASGGRTASGGEIASGGSSSTGGVRETGGARSTGGMTSTGGRTAPGSTPGTGGATGQDAGPDVASVTGGAGTGGQSGGGGSGGTAKDSGSTTATVASAGCGKTPTLASGSRTISSSGQNRSYMLRIPPDYDKNHPYPLVFAFHWNGGTMGDIDGGGSSGYTWSYYGLREQADNSTNAKMIFVAPQGNGNGWANSGGQDLTLVDDMLKQLEGDLCVDTTRVFAMGFSYGGGMSYAIACARATAFRAVAVYSGAQLSGCTGGNDPIAYIGIHGVSDGTCNISGGRSLRDRFVKNNTCTAQNPPEPSAGSGKHICTSYSGCSSGHPVRWCAFDGGHDPSPKDRGQNTTWNAKETWDFFTQF
jgi:poly(3-hydroxybutyrate) depolymerase